MTGDVIRAVALAIAEISTSMSALVILLILLCFLSLGAVYALSKLGRTGLVLYLLFSSLILVVAFCGLLKLC